MHNFGNELFFHSPFTQVAWEGCGDGRDTRFELLKFMKFFVFLKHHILSTLKI